MSAFRTWSDNAHNRTGSEQKNLFPNRAAFLLPDSVDLIQNDSNASVRRGKKILKQKKNYLFIRGVHTLAKGGDKSIIANISGTVTNIWQFCGLCTR
jgi:hypothetical protein